MDGRPMLLAALLLAVPLAGCLGTDADEHVEAAREEGTEGNASAPEGRGPIVAFEETNETEEGAGGVDHDHDYWAGRERVTVLADTVSLGLSGSVSAAQERRVTLRPEQGALVFEATASVDVTLSNPRRPNDVADPAGTPAPSLRYKHAATTSWIDVGAPSWGQPTTIVVTDPAQTDMPHATWSLWEFQLSTTDVGAPTLTFDVTTEIQRGDADVPLWPGHPAFYTDGPVRRVLETDAVAGDQGIVGRVAPVATEPSGPVHAERVVSYGTKTLFVYVNVSDFEVTNPLDTPTNFYLWHTNASGRWNATNLFDREKHPADQMEHLWVLRVDEAGMDSPYADGSRFAFELGAAFTQGAPGVFQLSCYGGCATWSANYRITVLASDQEVAPELYED